MYIPGKNRKPAIIFELGSFITRGGYAGEDFPQAIIPSDIGFIRENEDAMVAEESVQTQKKQKNFQNIDFNMINCPPDIAQLTNPCSNYFIEDWDLVEFQLDILLKQKMQAEVKDNPVFFVEPAISKKDFKYKMIELIFEKFGASSACMQKAPVLSSYIFAKENIIILDSGANFTQCCAIQDGYLNNKTLMKCNIGGETLTRELYKILNERKPLLPRYRNDLNTVCQDLQYFGKQEIVREIKHQKCSLLEFKIEKLKFNSSVDNTSFELPDKTKIDISKEMYAVPELLFKENQELNFKGLHTLIYQTLEKCESDQRKELLANIFVVGGNTMLVNFMERLQKEMYDLELWSYANKVKIFTAPQSYNSLHSSWLGGSILCSMQTYDQYALTKEDYEEHGSVLIERKLFL